jgi:hypothetical protein
MTTTEWPNPCGGRCDGPLGLVSDVDLIVDPHTGEMRHYACADPLLIADDDQKEGRWLRRLADMKPSEITAVMNEVKRRSDALRALPMGNDLAGERQVVEELRGLDDEFKALWTYQESRIR